jgi:hypothetical protein
LGDVSWSPSLPFGRAVVDRFDVGIAPNQGILSCIPETPEALTSLPFREQLLIQRLTAAVELEPWFPDLASLEFYSERRFWNENVRIKIFPIPTPVV